MSQALHPAVSPESLPTVALCVSVFSAAVLNLIALRRRPSSLVEPVGDILPSIPQISFGPKTVLPDGRTIISCSLKELQMAHSDNTIDQFNRLLGGKWIKTSGAIENNHGDGKVYLTSGAPLIILQFADGWIEQLSMLPRGSRVTIRGKVKDADILAIDLCECELL